LHGLVHVHESDGWHIACAYLILSHLKLKLAILGHIQLVEEIIEEAEAAESEPKPKKRPGRSRRET
jgi:hypothetical protein